jgi:hypothetical protein
MKIHITFEERRQPASLYLFQVVSWLLAVIQTIMTHDTVRSCYWKDRLQPEINLGLELAVVT